MEAEDKHTDDTSSSDEAIGVGAGPKGKKKCSASPSKKSEKHASTSTKRLTKSDDTWPKDLPSDYNHYIKSCNSILRAAIHQGVLGFCWAIAIVRCIEALLNLKRNIVVELSPQHLVNYIRNKDPVSGKVNKYNEIKKFLMDQGLVLENTCPYSGEINQDCPKSCQNSDETAFKIRDLVYMKGKEVNEEELIKIVNEGPILAVVEAYQSFLDYKDGIYEGQTNRKDISLGRHVVLVTGFGSTSEGVNYWIVQNSWGTQWGKNGYGQI